MKMRIPDKHRPAYRNRDTVKEPITIAEFLADPNMPAIRMVREKWDREKNTWKRLERQSGPAGEWRVGLFNSRGKLEKLFGGSFDSQSGEDRTALLEGCLEWVDLDFGDHYLGLIATGLKVVQSPKTAAKSRRAAR